MGILIKKVLFLILVLSATFLVADEPSAYGAGDINSPDSYGLTDEEKAIKNTSDELKKVKSKVNTNTNKIEDISSRLEGLNSVLDGISKKNHQNELELKKIQDELKQKSISNSQYNKRLEESISQNLKEIEKLKKVSEEFQKIITDMQNNYITKDELKVVVDNFNKFKKTVLAELKKRNSSSSGYKSIPSSKLYTKARSYYDKKKYDKAIELYKELIRRNYKPARSHFMIGESYYYKRDYGSAIAFYKKSAKLYDKASYMPILLLHTAVSMQKTGDRQNAKKFFNAVVVKYPNTKYAKTAKKYLK